MFNKYLIKYNELPKHIKASMWFLICSFIQKGISVITTPIFTRLLSTKQYGIFSIYNSWSGIVTVLVTLNIMAGVYAQGLVKFENEKKVYTSSLQGLCSIMCLCWMIIYLIFNSSINKLIGLSFLQTLLMMIDVWLLAVFQFWSVEQRNEFEYKKLVQLSILVSILSPLVSVVFVVFSQDKVTARILGMVLVDALFFVRLFYLQMKEGKVFFHKKYWIYAIKFNVPLIPHYLSTNVLNSSDRIMIGKLISEEATGIYSLGYSIAFLMTIFNTALLQTLEPWIYKKIKNKDFYSIKKVAYPSFFLIAVVNLILIAFAPEAIKIFAPSSYYEAMWIIPPVAMSTYFMFLYAFFATFEFFYEQRSYITFATLSGAVLNIILNYIFINIFGYIAAAYTTLLCFILFATLHYIFMKKICREKINNIKIYDVKIIVGISSILIVLGIFLMSFYKYIYIRYLIIFFFLILCLIFKNKIILQINNILKVKGD